MYLTYQKYLEMGGTLDETAFNEYEFEAETRINYVTFNRLKNEAEIPAEVEKCMFAIMRQIEKQAVMLGNSNTENSDIGSLAMVASRSNDGVSESYNILSASEILLNSQADIDKTIKRYLADVTNSLGQKLLYRGLYEGE